MQQPAAARAPLVWRDMDQKALDDAYDQLVYAPNRDHVLGRMTAASERVRKTLPASRVAYGPSDNERLDIYRAAGEAAAPINVFVHGGAWLRGVAAESALFAEPLIHAGAHAVIIDFTNVGETGGDLVPLYRQVSHALAWVWRNAASFGGDRNRLYLSAASSGAHLAGCALTTGWREEKLPADFCKGALLCGGMYDLEPVRLSKRSAYVKISDAVERDLSPQRHIDGIATPLILAYGTCETPEFQRQTRDFFAALQKAGKRAELLVGEHYNHFEMFETLASPYGLIGRARLRQMGLA
jgi:arylformamidase